MKLTWPDGLYREVNRIPIPSWFTPSGESHRTVTLPVQSSGLIFATRSKIPLETEQPRYLI